MSLRIAYCFFVLSISGFCTPPPRAFIANESSDSVSVLDLTANTLLTTISTTVGGLPIYLAATSDGSKVYVLNSSATPPSVDVIDNTANPPVLLVGASYPIPVGNGPFFIVTNPSGTRVFVSNGTANTVSVIDTATDTVISTITLTTFGVGPRYLTVTPDGQRLYVGSRNTNVVSVIDIPTLTEGVPITMSTFPPLIRAPFVIATPSSGSPIFVLDSIFARVHYFQNSFTGATDSDPGGAYSGIQVMGLTPDGSKGYVPNGSSNSVALIDVLSTTLATFNTNISIPGSATPNQIAVNPAGTIAYVTDSGQGDVYAIDTSTQAVTTIPITATTADFIAVSSDNSKIVVSNNLDGTATIINASDNSSITITIGTSPQSVVIPPSTTTPTPTPTPTPATNAAAIATASATAQQSLELVNQAIANAIAEIKETGIFGVIEGTFPDTINTFILDTPFTTQIQIPPSWCQ